MILVFCECTSRSLRMFPTDFVLLRLLWAFGFLVRVRVRRSFGKVEKRVDFLKLVAVSIGAVRAGTGRISAPSTIQRVSSVKMMPPAAVPSFGGRKSPSRITPKMRRYAAG